MLIEAVDYRSGRVICHVNYSRVPCPGEGVRLAEDGEIHMVQGVLHLPVDGSTDNPVAVVSVA